MEIDELEEIEKEIHNLVHLSQNEKVFSAKLKTSLKDLQVEHSQLKKILRAQLKVSQT